MALAAGSVLGPYRILELIGKGGMGEVYRARDERLGRDVAVKVLPASADSDPVSRASLLREARTASALAHPNICTVFDVGESNGRLFFAMELLSGRSLGQALGPPGLPLEEVVGHGIQVAAALAHAHGRGVVHCDLKPANIMLTGTGIKVLDFGIARQAQLAAGDAVTRPTAGVEVTTWGGTPGYMAPEQLKGQTADERSDVWALGVVLYEMAAGRLPFRGESIQELSAVVLRDPPEPLPDRVPAGLRAVIDRCLRKDPGLRYQRASEVGAALDMLLSTGLSTAAAAGGRPAGRESRRFLALAAGGLAIVAVLATGFTWWRSPAPASDGRLDTLAILPLRALNQEAKDDYLGLGIADALITKASQFPGVTVRPMSAVRRFARTDVDAVTAARTLRVDAVLDGSVQRADQRVRVSVNLLRARDGSSVWAETFDASSGDIFALEDDIARAVAGGLQVRLGPSEQAALTRRYTSSPEAFNYYTKAMFHLADRGFEPQDRGESDAAVALFRKALTLDPGFALARAQLAYAVAWTAIFIENSRPLMDEARREVDAAERQDPALAEVHVARSLMLWSQYEGWNVEAAIRELREARRINPGTGHDELGDLYGHIGLDTLAEEHYRQAIALDPTCETCKWSLVGHYYESAQPEEAAAAERQLLGAPPEAMYYLLRLMPREAEPLVQKEERSAPGATDTVTLRAILSAMQGKRAEAEASVRRLLEGAQRNRSYHHRTYDAATVYAQLGRPRDAVHWLRETVDAGFCSYSTFARDRLLDPIRRDPEFIAFLSEMKSRWERYRVEFERD